MNHRRTAQNEGNRLEKCIKSKIDWQLQGETRRKKYLFQYGKIKRHNNQIQRNAKEENMALKYKWTEEEDNLLRSLKEQKGINSWILISKEINKIQGAKPKTPKQCRERYINYVKLIPLSSKTASEWTPEENKIFLKFYRLYGAKWAAIARQMEGRSEISLKNRFYSSFRKLIRKINAVEQKNKTSKKRLLKYENLIRILEAEKQFKQSTQNCEKNLFYVIELRNNLLDCIQSLQTIENEEVECLIQRIHKFNSMFSYFGMRKVKFHLNSKFQPEPTLNSSEKSVLNLNTDQKDDIVFESSMPDEGQENISNNKSMMFEKYDFENDLLDIFHFEALSMKKQNRHQDLEEEVSQILREAYEPEKLPFF